MILRTLILTLSFLLAVQTISYAMVDYAVTSITGPRSDLSGGNFIGAATWDLQAESAGGQVLTMSTGLHSGFGIGSNASSGYEMNLGPFSVPGLGGTVDVDGVSVAVLRVDGTFAITHETVSTSLPRVPLVGTPPGFFEYQTSTISGIPVNFDIDFDVYSSASSTIPEFRIQGNGTGTGEFVFHTLGPENSLTGIRNIKYDLTPAGAVPEPGSVLVWFGLLAATVCYRRLCVI